MRVTKTNKLDAHSMSIYIMKVILFYTIIILFCILITSAEASTAFKYNGNGQRVEAGFEGELVRFVYDQSGNVIAETDESGNILRSYIYAGGSLLAMVEDGEYYSYHFNGTGHTVAITDDDQNIINAYNYDPYGKELVKEEQIEQPFKYAGQGGVLTDDNGLIFMKARYYDPESLRFLKEDPIGFEGGMNHYGYVNGDPISFIDPSGLRVANIAVFSGQNAFGVSGLNHAYVGALDNEGNFMFGVGPYGSINHSIGNGVSPTFATDPYRVVDLGGQNAGEVMKFLMYEKDVLSMDQGLWLPYLNDCHKSLKDSFKKGGIKWPGVENGRMNYDNQMGDAIKRGVSRAWGAVLRPFK